MFGEQALRSTRGHRPLPRSSPRPPCRRRPPARRRSSMSSRMLVPASGDGPRSSSPRSLTAAAVRPARPRAPSPPTRSGGSDPTSALAGIVLDGEFHGGQWMALAGTRRYAPCSLRSRWRVTIRTGPGSSVGDVLVSSSVPEPSRRLTSQNPPAPGNPDSRCRADDNRSPGDSGARRASHLPVRPGRRSRLRLQAPVSASMAAGSPSRVSLAAPSAPGEDLRCSTNGAPGSWPDVTSS